MTRNNVATSPPSTRAETLQNISNAWRGIKQHMHVRIGERVRAERVTSLPQCMALGSICARTDMTVKKIAELLGITSPAATQLIQELASQDLVKKVPNPEDSRSLLLHPTAAGKRNLAKTDKIVTQEFEKILTSLTDDELAEYARLTKKIATTIYEK